MSPPTSTDGRIHIVLVLGDNFPAPSIISTLSKEGYDVHVAHPHEPKTLPGNAIYHITKLTGAALAPLFTSLKPDVVISTTASSHFASNKAMIDAITSADISRFIPSEFGHDSLNEKIQARLPAYKERAETIKYLEQVAEDGRLSWSAAATGTTLDRGIVNGSLGFDLAWRSATLHGSGDEKFAASSVAWIGKVVATMLRSWEAVEGKYLHAAGLVTCANEVVQCLSIAMGKQWDAEPGDVEVCVMEAEQRIEKGFVDAGMFLLERSLMYDESLVATRPFRERDSLKSLGMEGETVEEVVRAALHESEHHRAGGGGCGCD